MRIVAITALCIAMAHEPHHHGIYGRPPPERDHSDSTGATMLAAAG